MIAIIDYGVGNLFSLKSSLESIGAQAVVTKDPEVLKQADHLILPGVGAFGDAMEKLRSSGMQEPLLAEAANGKPIMGICLGMQMLFEVSYEYGTHKGLGLLPGSVVPLKGMIDESLQIPHIGWNGLHFQKKTSPLFADVQENDCVYFVHSYHAVDCSDSLVCTVEYGIEVTAAVEKGNIFGCQFHPEKSGAVGLRILKAFSNLEVPSC